MFVLNLSLQLTPERTMFYALPLKNVSFVFGAGKTVNFALKTPAPTVLQTGSAAGTSFQITERGIVSITCPTEKHASEFVERVVHLLAQEGVGGGLVNIAL